MCKMKPLMLGTIAFVFSAGLLSQAGCRNSGDVETLIRRIEPLRLRRAGGKIETITFAQAMDRHHEHEGKGGAVTSAAPAGAAQKHHAGEDHHDGLCIGVATGYQAIRFAAGRLFPNETPAAADLEISVAGAMRGVWDVLEQYAGRKLTRPNAKQKKMSPESFIFVARHLSTGRTLRFRLRAGLIPPKFFTLKNRGATCDDPALVTLKNQAARKILSISPRDCFESR